MTSDQQNIIQKASEIIDRFGGIRPMASKTGIPVTTIQGWKQRDAIPATRREELIAAANQHGIMLGDLLMEIAGARIDIDEVEKKQENIKRVVQSSHDDPDLRPQSNNGVMIAASALILVSAVIGVLFAFIPKSEKLTEQDKRIQMLENQIQDMRKASLDIANQKDAEISAERVEHLEQKVEELTAKTTSYAETVAAIPTTINNRVNTLENQVGLLKANVMREANKAGLQDFLREINSLQATKEGRAQINMILAKLPNFQALSLPDISVFLNSNPDVAKTFQHVAPEDMKTASMMMAIAQWRQDLSQDNQSFETPFLYLQSVLQPELQSEFDSLLPIAKTGIVTVTSLSQQFRQIAPQIVQASISHDTLGLQEKALSKLNEAIIIEKNGSRVNGTQTQIILDGVQKDVDKGDLTAALNRLNALEEKPLAAAQVIIKPIKEHIQVVEFKNKIEKILMDILNSQSVVTEGAQ